MDGAIIAIHSTYHKMISDYHVKRYERTQISLPSSLKMRKTYTLITVIMMAIGEFKKFCRNAWSEGKYNFITIDLTSDNLNRKYRKNLDCFRYIPNNRMSLIVAYT